MHRQQIFQVMIAICLLAAITRVSLTQIQAKTADIARKSGSISQFDYYPIRQLPPAPPDNVYGIKRRYRQSRPWQYPKRFELAE